MENHDLLKQFITSLVKGGNTCLIVKGEAGIGKSETTMRALNDLGYKKGEHYRYLNNYASPKAFFDFLSRSQYLKDPKILVLDDPEEMLKQSKIVGVLKGALWSVDGQRVCNWVNNGKNTSFNFTGKIIIIVNRFEEKFNLLNTIRDRSLFYEMRFTQEQLIELVRKRAAEQDFRNIPIGTRLEIVEYVIQRSAGRRISLRNFPIALDLYLGNPDNWKRLLEEQNYE